MPRASAARRAIGGFLLRAAAVYALLMLPWPGCVETYGRLYRAAAGLVFATEGAERTLEIVALGSGDTGSEEAWVVDTGIMLRMGRRDARGEHPVTFPMVRSSRYTGYMPTALALALIIATPLPWRRRARTLLAGAVLVHALVLSLLGLEIQAWSAHYGCHAASKAGSTLAWLCMPMTKTLLEVATWIGPYFVGPVFVWLLVALRPADLRNGLFAPAPADSASSIEAPAQPGGVTQRA